MVQSSRTRLLMSDSSGVRPLQRGEGGVRHWVLGVGCGEWGVGRGAWGVGRGVWGVGGGGWRLGCGVWGEG